MVSELDYIKHLGTTAIWLTPSFKNKPVQGLGTPFPSAAYHGYWITDFTQIDPHLGTNQDLRDLIAGAHRRGMKVFFDIITNHTADVIDYREAKYDYVSKATSPYRDAQGTVFDDRTYAGKDTFPTLDPDVSFPYHPFLHAGDEHLKQPEWLNDLTLYHNRGNTTFSGENSTYGDFFGLDDLFTENVKVVHGMEGIYDTWIRDFGVDGFRIDTMKHVNLEFWQQFLPHIGATARSVGKSKFFAFGEVADQVSNPFLSRFTTAGRSQAVLDFPFQQQAREFAASHPTDQLRTLFGEDDWFTDADSNAYQLPTFLGNHDMGHIGMFLRDDNPGAPESELLRRDQLAHSLLYLSRGDPVVYFGDEQGFTGAGNDQAARQDMFGSRDSEYNNLDDDGTDPLNGQNLNDGGKNDNIGSDVTPAADNFDRSHPLYRTIAGLARLRQTNPALADGAQQTRYSSPAPGIFAFSRTDAREQVEYLVALNNSTSDKDGDDPHLLVADEVLPALGRRLLAAEERPRQDCRGHRPRALGRGLPRRAPAAAPQERSGDRADRRPAGERAPGGHRHGGPATRSTRSRSTPARPASAAGPRSAPTTARPTASSPTSRATRWGPRSSCWPWSRTAPATSRRRAARPRSRRRPAVAAEWRRCTTTAPTATTPAGACTSGAMRSPTASARRGRARARPRASTTSAPCSRSRSRTRRRR